MTQKSVLYSAIPFVGFHEVMKLEVLERVALSNTPLRPLVNIDKGRVWGGP